MSAREDLIRSLVGACYKPEAAEEMVDSVLREAVQAQRAEYDRLIRCNAQVNESRRIMDLIDPDKDLIDPDKD